MVDHHIPHLKLPQIGLNLPYRLFMGSIPIFDSQIPVLAA